MSRRPLLASFNLHTMSGIHPGRRSAVFQRLLVQQVDSSDSPALWLQVSWDGQPPGPAVHADRNSSEGSGITAFRLATPDPQKSYEALSGELKRVGFDLHACGACAFWDGMIGVTADGLPAGRCTYPVNEAEPVLAPPALAVQSAFSLACTHWTVGDKASAARISIGDAGDSPHTNSAIPAPSTPEGPKRRPAPSQWQRLHSLLTRSKSNSSDSRSKPIALPKKVTAVGTEPCFVCQGRIARLDSHTIATQEGDNETFTVWRCHTCYTTYLGDWIDRWVRLDSLETQEAFYRIPPAVASDLLGQYQAAKAEREIPDARERLELRLRRLIAETEPLSRQLKQGR